MARIWLGHSPLEENRLNPLERDDALLTKSQRITVFVERLLALPVALAIAAPLSQISGWYWIALFCVVWVIAGQVVVQWLVHSRFLFIEECIRRKHSPDVPPFKMWSGMCQAAAQVLVLVAILVVTYYRVGKLGTLILAFLTAIVQWSVVAYTQKVHGARLTELVRRYSEEDSE